MGMGMRIGLSYRKTLTSILKHFKVPLDSQTSLKFTLFNKLICRRMDDEVARFTQSKPRVNPEMKFKRSWMKMSLLWRCLRGSHISSQLR